MITVHWLLILNLSTFLIYGPTINNGWANLTNMTNVTRGLIPIVEEDVDKHTWIQHRSCSSRLARHACWSGLWWLSYKDTLWWSVNSNLDIPVGGGKYFLYIYPYLKSNIHRYDFVFIVCESSLFAVLSMVGSMVSNCIFARFSGG